MFGLIGRSIGSLYQVVRGLRTVFIHTFREPITQEFPDTMPTLPGTFRGRLALAVNPQNGEHLCISCLQCERVCPDKCIQITSHKSPETNKPELIEFKIDHGLCMFCGLCTEVCPTSCIINTNDFEMSDYTRESLVYDLRKLTLSQDESAHYFGKKELPMPKPKPAKPAAKPAAAAQDKPAAAAKPAAKPPAEGAAPEAKPEAAPAPKPAEVKEPATAPSAEKAPATAEVQKEESTPVAEAPKKEESAAPAEAKPAAEPEKKEEASASEAKADDTSKKEES